MDLAHDWTSHIGRANSDLPNDFDFDASVPNEKQSKAFNAYSRKGHGDTQESSPIQST